MSEYIVAREIRESIGCNHIKTKYLSSMMKGKRIALLEDDKDEYKAICDALNLKIQYTTREQYQKKISK